MHMHEIFQDIPAKIANNNLTSFLRKQYRKEKGANKNKTCFCKKHCLCKWASANMINRSPLCTVFTSDLHYCTAVLKWPTRLISASTSFIKIYLHIKFTLIYEFAFSAVHLNATLPNFLQCSPAGCRAEIFQDENKLKMVAEGLLLSKNGK